MRTEFYSLCILSVICGVVSACDSLDSDRDPVEQTIVFTCTAPEVKTVLSSDDTTMYWAEYDRIATYLYEDYICKASDTCDFKFTSVSLKSAQFYPQVRKNLSDWSSDIEDMSTTLFYAYAPVVGEMPVPDGYKVNLNVPALQKDDYGPYQISVASSAYFAQVVPLIFTPATSIFSVRCHITEDSPCVATKITSIKFEFVGAKVTGDCVLDMSTGVLAPSEEAVQSEIVLEFSEPVVVSRVLDGGLPSHFNKYLSCSTIPSRNITEIRITIYDKDENSFDAVSHIVPSGAGLAAGTNFRCDCFFFVDKVAMSDSVDGEGDEGFSPDWEVEL